MVANVVAHVPFAYSLALNLTSKLSAASTAPKDGTDRFSLAIGTVALNDSAQSLSVATSLLFNLTSPPLLLRLPALDLMLLSDNQPVLALTTPFQTVTQNLTAAALPTPRTPSGLPLTPCAACASLLFTATISNATATFNRSELIRVLNTRPPLAAFALTYGSAQAQACLLNRLIVGVNLTSVACK